MVLYLEDGNLQKSVNFTFTTFLKFLQSKMYILFIFSSEIGIMFYNYTIYSCIYLIKYLEICHLKYFLYYFLFLFEIKNV